MSDVIEGKGSCLCGAVHFTTRMAQKSIGACHCDMCRKWGGGPYMSVRCESEVSFDGKDSITQFGSSAWADRGFCKSCGTHLFFRLKESGHHFIPAGLFDNQDHFTLDRQVYIDSKPHYYEFSNKTSNMTEAEILEMIGK